MKFAFISGDRSTFAWQRLIDEGHEVAVYRCAKDSFYGDGFTEFMPSIQALTAWGGTSAVYVFDMNNMKVTGGLGGLNTAGKVADRLRYEGKLVLCGGVLPDKLEEDRAFGQRVAKSCGFDIPESHNFPNFSAAIKWLEPRDDAEKWHFKSDKYIDASVTFGAKSVTELIRYMEYLRDTHGDNIPNHLELHTEGVPMSTMGWFNGDVIISHLVTTLEHKRFLNGDLGPNTGCEITCCWTSPTHWRVRPYMNKFAEFLKKNDAPPGMYDCNVIFTKEKAYFLEWTPRFGYDSEATAFQLVPDLGQFLLEVAAGVATEAPYDNTRASWGVRLSIPPYPNEHLNEKRAPKNGAYGVPIHGVPEESNEGFAPYGLGVKDNEYFCADPYGIVGVALSTGTDIRSMNKKCVEFAKGLEVPNLQMRTDGDKHILSDLENLKSAGFPVPFGW